MAEPEQPPTDLVTVAQARAECRIADTDHGSDKELATYIGIATDLIENETGRNIVARATDSWEEAHEILVPVSVLYVKERPIRKLDFVKVGGAPLDQAVLYYEADTGRLSVISPMRRYLVVPGSFGPLGADFPEDANFRFGTTFISYPVGLVSVKYLGGYESRDDVPGTITRACLTLVARQYREMVRKSQGLSSESSGIGSTTKFDPAIMPADVKATLRSERTFTRSLLGARAS